MAAADDGRQPGPEPRRELLNRASFELFRRIVGPLLRAYTRMRVHDRPALSGPYVLAANHSSMFDPLLLGAAAPRRITYLMTAVIHRSPALGWFYRWMRTIPVPLHGAHQSALRAARRALAQGEVVGLFPEGGISRDGRLMLGNPGAMSLVLGEQVPIVPAGIVGASRVLPFGARWPRPARVEVRFGAPIPPDAFAEAAGPSRRRRLEAGTRLLMEEIARLTGQVARERELAEKNRRS